MEHDLVPGKKLAGKAADFLKVLLWEFIQNLPILAGFTWALSLWKAGQFLGALCCILAGAIGTAVAIALTEARKQGGYHEPFRVILANIGGMSLFALLLVLYMGAPWSAWWTDLLCGAALGVCLGVLQSLAAKKKTNWVHCAALGAASPLVLLSLRWLIARAWPNWWISVCMSAAATLVIGMVDYAEDVFNPADGGGTP